MSENDKDGEKSVADTPIGTTVSSSSVSPMLPTSSSTTYTNGNTERKNQINGAADASSSSIADHSTTADVKERPPSLLKLVIPAHEAAREGLTSVSSSSDPSSSSSISSPDSVSSSHSRSGLLSDPSTPQNATTDQPLDKKRTYSAHELHSWDSSAKSGGPPSFNRSVTASSVDRKHSLQSSMGPPPSFGLVSTSLQVEIQAVTLPADGIKEVEDDKSTHTVFALEVRLVSGLRWVIEKRYSDFRDFHDRMKKANASVRNLPFPKKHYFRGKSHSVIEQRRLDLERYVKDILHVQPLMKMPIFNFLAVYAHLESYDRKKRRQQKEVDLKRMKNLLAPDELADVQAAFQRLCTSKATAIASVAPSSKQPTPQPTTTAATTNSNINSPKSPAVLAPTLGPAADASTYADGGGGPSTSSSSISSSSSSAASSSAADNNLMSKTAFRRDVLSVFPDMPSTFAIRFMKGFSDKSSNDISVDEFVRAVAILRHGSTDDQLLFSFNMCDHDHLGKLQSTGLSNLLVSLYGRPVIDKPEYKRVVNDLFDYGRTRLTADEFVHAMLTQPLDHVALVLDWMPSFMHILCETASPSLLELQEDYNPVVQQKILETETAFSAADIAMLQDAFAMYRSGGSSSSATSSTSHASTSQSTTNRTAAIDLELLAADFALQVSDARLVTAFASFGPRANGVDIDVFSFVHALHIACRGSWQDKTRFGFRLFSSSGNPEVMTRDDLVAMLQLEVLVHSPVEGHIRAYFPDCDTVVVSTAQIGMYVDLVLRSDGDDSSGGWTLDLFTKWAASRDHFQVAALDMMKRTVFAKLGLIPANKAEEIDVARLCYQPYDPSALVQGDHWFIVDPVWFDHWRRYVEFIPVLDTFANPNPKARTATTTTTASTTASTYTSTSSLKASLSWSPPKPQVTSSYSLLLPSPETKRKGETGVGMTAFNNLRKPVKMKPIDGSMVAFDAAAAKLHGPPPSSSSSGPSSIDAKPSSIVDTDNNIVRPKYIGNMALFKDKQFAPTDDMLAGKHFAVVCEPLWRALKAWYGGGPEIKQTVVVLSDGRATLDLWGTERQHAAIMDGHVAASASTTDASSSSTALAASKYKRMRGGGSLGLINLGNTCYMNSALQCIVNTPLFVDYFLSGMYMDDINRTSTLGMQGKLAEVYGKLLEDLWSTKFKHVSPREFKKTIGKFNEAFRGNDQQDAQELIAFLLSGLSEDLNRIHDKPYISQPDSDGRYDSDLADEWWRNHLKREVSIVVALFTGQYKSLLTCSACGFKSARFEPFTFLQVPLPEPTHNNVTIPVVFADSRMMPQKLSLRLSIDATIVELKKQLVDVCVADFGLPLHSVADIKICEYAGAHIVGFKADNRKLGQIRSIDRLMAFQLEPLAPRVVDVARFRRPSLIPYESPGDDDYMEEEDVEVVATDELVTSRGRAPMSLHPHMLVEVQIKGEWVAGTVLTTTTSDTCAVQLRHGDVEENVSQTRVRPRPARLLYCPVISRKLGYSPVYFKNPFRPLPFGTPDLVRICPEMTTGAALYAMVWDRVHRFFKQRHSTTSNSSRRGPPRQHSISGPVQHIDELFCHQDLPFLLRRVESKGSLVQFPIHGLNLASCVAPFEEFPSKYPDKKAAAAEVPPEASPVDHPIKDMSPAPPSTASFSSPPSANINRARRGYTNTNLEQSRCLETHYDLYGVVNHQGALGGGHYTAYAKNSMDGNWYCYDDERVRLIEESKVVTASAYLCFYVRKDMAEITVDAVYPPKKDGKITDEDIDRFVEESDKGKCALM
ncbi:hypothetical protein DYB35_009117 [Aphanomyces astaci]|uniref:ubiquitinyl hydrolase 1 n=1 Tax=Aphanomyces astaci TaxID=112090 RepID=A0A3R6ZF86_APHAT|nr:hypothetical protein DYB35_009117 [Aphanomyces astaci]